MDVADKEIIRLCREYYDRMGRTRSFLDLMMEEFKPPEDLVFPLDVIRPDGPTPSGCPTPQIAFNYSHGFAYKVIAESGIHDKAVPVSPPLNDAAFGAEYMNSIFSVCKGFPKGKITDFRNFALNRVPLPDISPDTPPHEWKVGDRGRIAERCPEDGRGWEFGVFPVGYEFVVDAARKRNIFLGDSLVSLGYLLFHHEGRFAQIRADYVDYVERPTCKCPISVLMVQGCQCGGE